MSRSRLVTLALTCVATWAWAGSEFDRVGRLTELQGEVSFYDPDRGEWTDALRNRPVIAGDRLVLAGEARAEVRVAGAVLLLARGADVEWLGLDGDQLRLRLREGSLALRLPSRRLAEQTEILTDETRLRPLRAGDYRVDREDGSTFAAALRGSLEASGGGLLLMIDAGERHEIYTDRRRDVARSRPARLPQDRLAAWSESVWHADDRDAQRDAETDAYLPDDLPGADDLARYGRWDRHPEYGALWYPVGVQLSWQPFRDGRWIWMRPWGWTWIDAAPWGFATSHYGRWVQWRGRWGWWPGPRHVRPVFAPAVVAWVGGSNVSLSVRIGDVAPPAWAPLPPWQPYVPIVVQRPYPRPPGYVQPLPQRRLPPPSAPISRPPSVTYGTQGVPVGVQAVPSRRSPSVTYGKQGVPVGVQAAPSARVAPVTSVAPAAPAAPAVQTTRPAPAVPFAAPARRGPATPIAAAPLPPRRDPPPQAGPPAAAAVTRAPSAAPAPPPQRMQRPTPPRRHDAVN